MVLLEPEDSLDRKLFSCQRVYCSKEVDKFICCVDIFLIPLFTV